MFNKSIEKRLKKEGNAFVASRISVDVTETDVFVVIDSEEYFEYKFQSNKCKTTSKWSKKHGWRGQRVKLFTDFVLKCIASIRGLRVRDLLDSSFLKDYETNKTIENDVGDVGKNIVVADNPDCPITSMSDDDFYDFVEDLFGDEHES